MVWGKHEKHLKRIQKKGQIRVKALEDRPILEDDLEFVWAMWNSLHRTRQAGAGATPIPFSEAVCWINFYCPDYSINDKDLILDLYFSLEDEWLTWARQKQESENNR